MFYYEWLNIASVYISMIGTISVAYHKVSGNINSEEWC